MRKFLLILLGVAIAAFSVAACDSNGDSMNLGAFESSPSSSSSSSEDSSESSSSSSSSSSTSSSSSVTTDIEDDDAWTGFY